jgi:integrase/recombinase XerD
MERYRRRMVVQHFASSTIASYLSALKGLVLFVGKTTDKIVSEEVFAFLIYQKEDKGLSRETMRISVSAFRHYYKIMENRPDIITDVPYPKQEKHLPVVLSGAQVKLLLESTHNPKHRLIMKLAYSAGLRRGEIINLKKEDIDRKRMTIRVNQGKGRKDRYTLLAKDTLRELEVYMDQNKASQWLLNGRIPGTRISEGALDWMMKNARERVSIGKKFHLHSLRHSFASHLLIMGVNLVAIQRLLGHEDIRTTMIYLHVNFDDGQKLQSPLDIIYP